jgi:hypothetical protein
MRGSERGVQALCPRAHRPLASTGRCCSPRGPPLHQLRRQGKAHSGGQSRPQSWQDLWHGIAPHTGLHSGERSMAQRRPCYHSPPLRAIANARGNIPQHLSTARQRLTGGTGSKQRTPVRRSASTISASPSIHLWHTVRSALPRRGIICSSLRAESKKDLVNAIRKYCQ